MPYARCPVCQQVFHLAVRGSPVEWEREHVKERAADGTPLLKCIRCWVTLRPGHKVTVREIPDAYANELHIGQEGIVQTQAASPDGEVAVTFGPLHALMKRETLFYVVGQEPVP